MSLKNTTDKFGSMAIFLHWIMAFVIITLVIVGFTMTSMEDGDDKWTLYGLHKATGLIVLVLALIRWYWSLSNEKPKPFSNWSKAEIGIAHGTKWLLLLMMLVMPIAGIIMSLAGGHDISFYGLFTIEGFAEKNKALGGLFHNVHEIGAWVIAIIIGLHILAALKHHLIDKDETLYRMLGRKK